LLIASRFTVDYRYKATTDPESSSTLRLARAMAKEGGGGVAASGAPQYGYSLFARDASAHSAIRTINGQRKHLDHILVDRLRANELTYGVVAGDDLVDERREQGSGTGAEAVPSTPSEEIEALVQETRAHRSEPYDPTDPKWVTPAFKVRDEDSITRAKTLSGSRSPSGALMSAENPSIARPPPKSTPPLK
jgi:hypothetical protein